MTTSLGVEREVEPIIQGVYTSERFSFGMVGKVLWGHAAAANRTRESRLRQRISRLVRDTLSFSKNLVNHIGAIKLFICHYNLTKVKAYSENYIDSTTTARGYCNL